MPALWRESFSAFTNLHPVQVPSAIPSRLTVMRYPLWGHPDIGLGLTVRWQRWAEVDIHIVGDLWDPDTKDWYPLHEVVDNTDRFCLSGRTTSPSPGDGSVLTAPPPLYTTALCAVPAWQRSPLPPPRGQQRGTSCTHMFALTPPTGPGPGLLCTVSFFSYDCPLFSKVL